MLGSAGAALTGLQFITVALLADMPIRDPAESDASDAFATPTIVHFVSVLLLAGLGAAPWHSLGPVGVLWGSGGVAGVVYTLIVIGRVRSQAAYEPVLEDWLCHALLPLVAYATLAAAGVLARGHATAALASVASAALLLLLIGVHNAWDNVTFIAQRKREEKRS